MITPSIFNEGLEGNAAAAPERKRSDEAREKQEQGQQQVQQEKGQSRSVRVGGSQMPMVGFGTYLIADEDCEQPVTWALEVGYRHIDTAEFYDNHSAIGRALKASGLPRESVFITDKISPNGKFGVPPKSYDGVLQSIRHQLKKLDTPYVDLILLHHPFPPSADRVKQYTALVDAQKAGLVKEIGVSNYSRRHIEELLAAGLPAPAANQIELHPLNTYNKYQPGLLEYLAEISCVPIAYSSLAPASSWRADQPGKSSKTEAHCGHLAVQKRIAEKYAVEEPALLLRWAFCLLPIRPAAPPCVPPAPPFSPEEDFSRWCTRNR